MMTFSYVLPTCCELGKYKVSIASVSHYNISVEVPIRVFSQICAEGSGVVWTRDST